LTICRCSPLGTPTARARRRRARTNSRSTNWLFKCSTRSISACRTVSFPRRTPCSATVSMWRASTICSTTPPRSTRRSCTSASCRAAPPSSTTLPSTPLCSTTPPSSYSRRLDSRRAARCCASASASTARRVHVRAPPAHSRTTSSASASPSRRSRPPQSRSRATSRSRAISSPRRTLRARRRATTSMCERYSRRMRALSPASTHSRSISWAQAVAHCTPEDAAHYCAALRHERTATEQAKVISAHVAALLQRRPQSDDIVESGCRGVAQMRDSAADARQRRATGRRSHSVARQGVDCGRRALARRRV
jgi:hypothetical protein